MNLAVFQHYETRASRAEPSTLAIFDQRNARFFSSPLPAHFHGTVKGKVALCCRLFSLLRTSANSKYWDHLERSFENDIVYCATPSRNSNEPHVWRGLALEVQKFGSSASRRGRLDSMQDGALQ